MHNQNLFAPNGYIEIPYSQYIDQKNVELLMSQWKSFCAQPLWCKVHHNFSHAGGYEYKDKSTGEYKENFHFSAAYDRPNLTSVETAFFKHAKAFLLLLEPIVALIGSTMNGDDTLDLSKLLIKEPERWTLRFLHYPPDEQPLDTIRAASHVDKGITLHITETTPGLQVLWNGEWQDTAPKEGHFLTYAGLNGQYYSHCKVPALCHRVCNSIETNKKGRYSIVLFIDFGDVTYDKGTFGRTQARFPQGENYTLCFDEFKQFFTAAENKVL